MIDQVGDFPSDIAQLMARSSQGQGPTTMSAIRAVAQALADRVDEDPAVLEWLRLNAMPLIGQQLLVASVNTVQDPAAAFEEALRHTTEDLGPDADTTAVIAELKENHPGALRAWLIHEQLPRLVTERLED